MMAGRRRRKRGGCPRLSNAPVVLPERGNDALERGKSGADDGLEGCPRVLGLVTVVVSEGRIGVRGFVRASGERLCGGERVVACLCVCVCVPCYLVLELLAELAEGQKGVVDRQGITRVQRLQNALCRWWGRGWSVPVGHLLASFMAV